MDVENLCKSKTAVDVYADRNASAVTGNRLTQFAVHTKRIFTHRSAPIDFDLAALQNVSRRQLSYI
jgi:hypothetical protein